MKVYIVVLCSEEDVDSFTDISGVFGTYELAENRFHELENEGIECSIFIDELVGE